MKTILLAAGYATRLYPLTENFPKPLLEVGGKPILDWLIADVESEEYIVYLKLITNKVLLYSTGNSAQCYVAAWIGGELGGEWIHVYVWLSPFSVHLKLSQHC